MGISEYLGVTMLAVFLLVRIKCMGNIVTPQPWSCGRSVDEHKITEDNSKPSIVKDPIDFHSSLLCDRGTCRNRCFQPYQGVELSWPSKKKVNDTTSPTDPEYTPTSNSSHDTLSTIASNNCQCDDLCVIFGDCCFDFFSLCRKLNLSTLISKVSGIEDVEMMIRSIVQDHSHIDLKMAMFWSRTCGSAFYNRSLDMYWMIDSCPAANENETAAEKCTAKYLANSIGLFSLPVSFIPVPGIVFRNVYCGICHGLRMTDLQVWDSHISCKNQTGYHVITNWHPEIGMGNTTISLFEYDDLIFKVSKGECQINTKPASKPMFRKCSCSDIIEGKDFKHVLLSRSYVYTVYSGRKAYRNPHSWEKRAHEMFDLSCYPVNTFDYHGTQMPQCWGNSCEGKWDDYTMQSRRCKCDKLCLVYGDCCYDFSLFHKGNMSVLNSLQNTTNLVMYLNTDNNLTTTDQGIDNISSAHSELIAKFLHHKSCLFPETETKGVWMIGICPKGFLDFHIISMCEGTHSKSLESQLPVSHKAHSEVIFRNRYCAFCHELSQEDVVPWNVSITCPIKHPYSSLNEQLKLVQCKANIEGYVESRQCFETDQNLKKIMEDCVHDTCVPPGDIDMCGLYRYEVRVENETFRNPHCAHRQARTTICSVRTSGGHGGSSNRMSSDVGGGLGILFSVNINDANTPHVTCNTNEVYDTFYRECRKLVCPDGMVAVSGRCVTNGTWFATKRNFLLPEGFSFFFVKVYFSGDLILERRDRDEEKSNVTEILYQNIKTRLLRNISVLEFEIMNNSLNGTDDTIIDSKSLTHMLEITFENKGSLSSHLNSFFLVDDVIFDNILSHDRAHSKVFVSNYKDSKNLTCYYGNKLTLQNLSLVTLESTLYANDTDRLYPLDKSAFTVTYQNTTPVIKDILVCGVNLDCNRVRYNLSQFKQVGRTLVNRDKNMVLEDGAFFISGETVISCHNFTQFIPLFFNFDPIQSILTYVVSGISVTGLVVTLIVHALLPELQNLPGRIIMSFSACLTIAQLLLLMIHLPTGILCRVLAKALHFFWLCSFMWMTVMSVNLAHTFTCKAKQSSYKTTFKTYFKFIFCATGIPLLIVATTVIVDFMNIPELYVGYGAHGICWVANPVANLLVFVLPVAIMLLVNTVAFILTYYNIEKSLRVSKNISSTRKETVKFAIYGKLFIIMGLSWSSSFVAAFTDINVIWYIFIILNGLQGFYIFISFICTDRVKGLLLKKVRGPAPNDNIVTTKQA